MFLRNMWRNSCILPQRSMKAQCGSRVTPRPTFLNHTPSITQPLLHCHCSGGKQKTASFVPHSPTTSSRYDKDETRRRSFNSLTPRRRSHAASAASDPPRTQHEHFTRPLFCCCRGHFEREATRSGAEHATETPFLLLLSSLLAACPRAPPLPLPRVPRDDDPYLLLGEASRATSCWPGGGRLARRILTQSHSCHRQSLISRVSWLGVSRLCRRGTNSRRTQTETEAERMPHNLRTFARESSRAAATFVKTGELESFRQTAAHFSRPRTAAECRGWLGFCVSH